MWSQFWNTAPIGHFYDDFFFCIAEGIFRIYGMNQTDFAFRSIAIGDSDCRGAIYKINQSFENMQVQKNKHSSLSKKMNMYNANCYACQNK